MKESKEPFHFFSNRHEMTFLGFALKIGTLRYINGIFGRET